MGRWILGIIAAALMFAQPAQSLVQGQKVYFGIYNYAGQKVLFWVFYRTRLPDGGVIWDSKGYVLDHRIRKGISVHVTRGRLASCEGRIGTHRRDAAGKTFETLLAVDLCKLYRVRLNSGRVGPTRVYLDFNKQRDRDAYRDPW